MAILGRTSSLLRQRFDRTEIEDASLDVEGKRDSLSLYDFYIKIQQLDHLGSPWQKSFPKFFLAKVKSLYNFFYSIYQQSFLFLVKENALF